MTSASPVSSSLRLRRADARDAAWLADFGARTFEAAYRELIDADEIRRYCEMTYGAERQRKEIEQPESTVLIAELDGTAAGFAWVVRQEAAATPPCVTDRTAVNLSRIYVDPACQSSGIGARLLEGAVTEARALGAESIWLAVWQENPRAIQFYERHGFHSIGRTGFPTDPDPECDHVMARWLGGCC